MDQVMLAALCRIIVGRYGRRLPAYPDIRMAFVYGLFADYYIYNPIVSIKSYYKYANGSIPYPHFLPRHYSGSSGYRRTLGDMMNLVDNCPSLSLLQQIQEELHRWIVGYLPAEEAETVCRNYAGQNATRREIVVFFADTIYFAISRDIVANRPNETNEELWYSGGKDVSQCKILK